MKKILILSLIVATLLSTGCTKKEGIYAMSKKELQKLAKSQNSELEGLYSKNEELSGLLKGVKGEEIDNSAIETMQDGTGRLTFKSFNDLIKFKVPFEYPNSSQIANTTSVYLNENIKMGVSSNWYMKFNGNNLELEHTSGINGIIKISKIDEMIKKEEIKASIFDKFTAELPPNIVEYNNIFLDETWWGIEGITEIRVDEKPSVLRFGTLAISEKCITYMFLYEGEKNDEKEETIINLLMTIQVNGKELKLG